jgi:biotin carboxyl carrier protein
MGDGFAVSVDGRLHQVDLARIDAHTMSLIVDSRVSADAQDRPDAASNADAGPKVRPTSDKVRPTLGGLVYETTLASEPDGRLVVLVGAMPVAVRLNGPSRGARGARGGRRQVDVAAGSGPLRIAAPMPGKVVRVLVRVGDAVRARQPVVVVEAMKMENELRADRDGTVAEIHVREGMSVEAGALLIVIQ